MFTKFVAIIYQQNALFMLYIIDFYQTCCNKSNTITTDVAIEGKIVPFLLQ